MRLGRRRRPRHRAAAFSVLLSSLATAAPGGASPPGEYSEPEWLPFRQGVGGGEIIVGCGYASGDGLCAGHHGYWAVDFIAATGTPVYAAGAGRASDVTGAGYGGYGNTVVIDHGHGVRSLYAHLAEVRVDPGGRWVTTDDVIGTVGATGGANTAHLHYEESSSSRFGSAGSRDPGPIKACHGDTLVTYPQALGASSWRGIPWGSGRVHSSGTECAGTGAAAGVIGAIETTAAGALAASDLSGAVAVPEAVPEHVTADFDGDGHADVARRDPAGGQFVIRHGPRFQTQVPVPWAPGAHLQALAADFDGDGWGDLGLRDPTTGMVYVRLGPSFSRQVTQRLEPGPAYAALAGDFDADRRGDIALWDSSGGAFLVRHGPDFGPPESFQVAAGSHLQALAADFNSDRMADLAFRDAGTGTFTIRPGPTYAGVTEHEWLPGAQYRALAGDFDGDGTADIGLIDASGAVQIRYGPAFSAYSATTGLAWIERLADYLRDLVAHLSADAF